MGKGGGHCRSYSLFSSACFYSSEIGRLCQFGAAARRLGLKTGRGPSDGAQDSGGHHRQCVGHTTIDGRGFSYPCGVLTTHDLPRPSRRGFSSESDQITPRYPWPCWAHHPIRPAVMWKSLPQAKPLRARNKMDGASAKRQMRGVPAAGAHARCARRLRRGCSATARSESAKGDRCAAVLLDKMVRDLVCARQAGCGGKASAIPAEFSGGRDCRSGSYEQRTR